MSDLTYELPLDGLDDDGATYVGTNGLHAHIDRAAYNNNGRPPVIRVVIPEPLVGRTAGS